MLYIAGFSIPPEALPFGEILITYPEFRIEVERIIPTHESAMPFFWVWGEEPELFIEAAEREPEISDICLLDQTKFGALFRAEWLPNAAIINGIKSLGATIVESEGTSKGWRFEIRAENRNTFPEFQRLFEEQGIPISLLFMRDLADTIGTNTPSLSPVQQETLIHAYREGYYDLPKQVTQAELGEHFGVSNRAISERLRRGIRNLIRATLIETTEQP